MYILYIYILSFMIIDMNILTQLYIFIMQGIEITALTLEKCESENADAKLKTSTENINKKLLIGLLDLNIDIGNYKNVIKILNEIKINLDNKTAELSNISDIDYQYYLAILYKFQGLYKLSYNTFNIVLVHYKEKYINHPNISVILGYTAEIQSSNCEFNDSLNTIIEGIFMGLKYFNSSHPINLQLIYIKSKILCALGQVNICMLYICLYRYLCLYMITYVYIYI
jgi:hypothetical protein